MPPTTPTILVAEDYEDRRELLRVILEGAGYRVLLASDGREALATLERQRVDVLVTDVHMPHVDGFELIARMREEPARRFIPVLVQTAAARDDESMRRGAEVGALSYLPAPYSPDVLLARVAMLVEVRAQFVYMAEEIDRLREQAHTDPLTGLANRRRFEQRLGRELQRSQRTGRPFSLVLIDLDDFKAVNDTHGHTRGDDVLRCAGGVLEEHTRGIDTAARYGGEELAVILAETGAAGARETAERLRRSLTTSCDVVGVGRITASFGVAEYPADIDGSTADQGGALIQAADAALYRAKREGKDRVCVYVRGEVGALR